MFDISVCRFGHAEEAFHARSRGVPQRSLPPPPSCGEGDREGGREGTEKCSGSASVLVGLVEADVWHGGRERIPDIKTS